MHTSRYLYISIYIPIYLSIKLYVFLSIYPSIHLSSYLSIYHPTFLSTYIHLSIYSYIHSEWAEKQDAAAVVPARETDNIDTPKVTSKQGRNWRGRAPPSAFPLAKVIASE